MQSNLAANENQKKYRVVKQPQVTIRYLADYMAASETSKRTIVQKCKFQLVARVIQHDEAKTAVSKFIREENKDTDGLLEQARLIRARFGNDFDQLVNESNADYIERFAAVCPSLELPEAELITPGRAEPIILHGVKVNPEIIFRLKRVAARTNKIRIGAAMLRYKKGTSLSSEVAKYQSAFLLGYLNQTNPEIGEEPEGKLCLTIDAHTGVAHQAPTDSIRRFNNMQSALKTIADWWPNIQPPI